MADSRLVAADDLAFASVSGGSFDYSHGLGRAIHDGLIRHRRTLVDWLRDLAGVDLIETQGGWAPDGLQ